MAEVIDLLSSPSLGPSPAQTAPATQRPVQPAVAVAATPISFDEDVFDLTADSPELAIQTAPNSFAHTDQRQASYSPRSIVGTKRPREEQASVDAPVYFMSDDFDSTIDLASSLPPQNDVELGPREAKRPRVSPPRNTATRSFEVSNSATDQPNRPPMKQSGGLRRTLALADPIEFSSSPGLSSRPTANTITKMDLSIESDNPFSSSPPTARPEPERHSPPKATSKPMSKSRPTEYDLTSDDPFQSSPRPYPRSKPTPQPCTITIDDDDDDDDPFASSPRRMPNEAQKPRVSQAMATSTAKGKQRAESPRRQATWDPISSSAPERQLPSDPFSSPPRRTFTKSVSEIIDLSDGESASANVDLGSDDDFPDLDNFDPTRLKTRIETQRTSSVGASRASKATKPTTARTTTKRSADDKVRDKEAKAAEREREKERKKQEKEMAKEQKAREKERASALAEVNKIRTDKKISTPEMIADLPSSLPAAMTLQIQTLLKDLDVQHNMWDSPVDNVVKWRRKVASRFNEELGHWEPVPMRIQPDNYALVIVTASDFVTHATGPEGSDLEAHVLKMKQHFPSDQLIYLIEGLTPWMRKNRNVRNRQFVSAVRNQAGEPSDAAPTSGQPRRRKNQQPQEYVDEDSIEDALLELQVMHDVLIHHTNAPIETAQWVAIFTQHISTVPYRKQREAANAAGAGFCMETGQVRTGEDVKDTYVRMLQEIARVTAPIAYSIAAKFETVPKLVQGMEEGGPLCLENLRKSTNKDGGFSDRAIGKSVSKRVYKVFTGTDELSADV